VVLTAMPAVKSRNVFSVDIGGPAAFASLHHEVGRRALKLGDIALASRAISSAALGPGSAVFIWGRRAVFTTFAAGPAKSSSGRYQVNRQEARVRAPMGSLARGTKATFSVRQATRDDLKAIVGIYNWAVNQDVRHHRF